MDVRPIFTSIIAISGCSVLYCMYNIRELTWAGWEVLPDEVSVWVWPLTISMLICSLAIILSTLTQVIRRVKGA